MFKLKSSLINNKAKSLKCIRLISYVAAIFFAIACNIIFTLIREPNTTPIKFSAINIIIFLMATGFYLTTIKKALKTRDLFPAVLLSGFELIFIPGYITSDLIRKNPFQLSTTLLIIIFMLIYFSLTIYKHLILKHWEPILTNRRLQKEVQQIRKEYEKENSKNAL